MKKLSFYKYKRTPMAHQRYWFETTKDEEYWGYAHDMGTGKTKILTDRIQYLYKKGKIEGCIIIAPKGVHEDHITKEIKKDLFDNLPYISAYYSSSLKKYEEKAIESIYDPKKLGLRIIAFNTDAVRTKKGYDLMVKFLDMYSTLFAIDEATDFANYEAQRSKALISLSHKAKYRLWMDGTPINQGPLDLYTPCEFLKPGLLGFPTFSSFKSRYAQQANGALQKDIDILVCQTRSRYKSKYGDKNWESFLTIEDLFKYKDELRASKQIYLANCEDKNWSYDRLREYIPEQLFESISGALFSLLKRTPLFVVGYKNLDELKGRIKSFTSRVELIDVVDMPKLRETNVYYDLSIEHRKLYKKLIDDYLIEIDDDIMSVEHAITLYGRLQQMLGGYYKSDDDKDKWKALPGKNLRLETLFAILNKIDTKYKILIASKYVEEIKSLERELKKAYGKSSTVTYFGGNSDEEQRMAKSELANNPDCRFFVMNPASGAKGLNLISANYLINYSRVFSYSKEKQLTARMYRKGQNQNCFKINIIAKNTMDDLVIAKAQDRKKDVADLIVNDIMKYI